MKEINGKADVGPIAAAPCLRTSMKRLLLVILVMACSVIVLLISTDNSGLFCTTSKSPPLYKELLRKYRHEFYHNNMGYLAGAGEESYYNGLRNQTGSGCDYAVGKWIKDENKPLYSGATCKRWLSGMWACRLMVKRPNFDYENYRWKPDGCDLPAFDAQYFLSRMRNKVLAFVGDSIGRQQYQSLMCMLTGGKDDALVEDVSSLFGLVKPPGALRADGTAQRFVETNTTVLYYWSASLCELQRLNKTDLDTQIAMHLDRPVTFIQKYLKQMDVLILNTGHHWNKGKMIANKWVMHVNGKVTRDRRFRDMSAARNFTVHSLIAWLDKQKINPKVQIYMRSISPRHFFNGEWDSGGRCDNDLIPVEKKNITGEKLVDPVAESAVLGTKVHLLNVTYLSQFRDEAHISKFRSNEGGQDCLHWCLPGIPDVWNELLYAELFFGNRRYMQ